MPPNTASAFVPGHVTIFFSPTWRSEPERSGSVGAGITLSDGVTVDVESATETRITVNGSVLDIEPVQGVLDSIGRSAQITAATPLPVGAGFGVSGALALGTALAANHVFGLNRSENELITLAHTAEVEAGTGLGDVMAQARGGIPIRLQPGAPHHGMLDGIPAVATIEYLSFGGLDTPDILAAEQETLEAAGDAAQEQLLADPSITTLFDTGWQFARDTELVTPEVDEVVAAVRSNGGLASMAMLGRTVIGLGSALSDAGFEPSSCQTHPPGATLR